VQVKDKQPVEIKEYLLPNRCFNEQESLQRKQVFQRVGGVKLADSRVQNFRLVNTIESVADEKADRCYLISQKIEASQTLNQYLTEKGKMTASQVREVLNQTLQTLEFLHSQKLRFPSNQVQEGMAHGNLNLNSILIKLASNQQFYIYLCDLAVWENLFIPPAITQPAPAQKEKDLEALGLVAFYLLAGRTVDYSNQPLDPRDYQQWSTTDSHLKQFIERLMGLATPFTSAEAARQELIKLPKEGQGNSSPLSEDAPANQKLKKLLLWLFVLALLLLGGGIAYYFWRGVEDDNSKYLQWNSLLRLFSDLPNVQPGRFNYTAERTGTWSVIIRQQVDNAVVEDIFTNPIPNAQAIFQYKPLTSTLQNADRPITSVKTKENNFAITSVTNNITDELDKKPVAYDGLLVYVEFSKRDTNLANALEGKITLEQLRQIYTGKITNWQQINSKLPNVRITPYKPTEPEAISKFQEIVLKNNPQDIALFTNNVTTQDTTSTQNQIRQEILNTTRSGIIAFGILSKTKGQCTGYPLAIANNNTTAIQPLFQKRDRRPINTSDDLCKHDDYFFDVDTFKTYPLGYPIFVVYPRDNSLPPAGSKFSEILTTRQGQCLLNKVGLVPLQPIPDAIKNYACQSLP
jgi:ABC-type phosphate transport system substrate-binding protein